MIHSKGANWEDVQNLGIALCNIKNGILYESITNIDLAFIELQEIYLKGKNAGTRYWMDDLITNELNSMIGSNNEGIQRLCYLVSSLINK